MAEIHAFNGSIVVRNVRNVLLVALERNADLPQIISECGRSGMTSNSYVECFGIRFKDVRDVTINSLILKMPIYATTGLTFIDSTGIVIQTLCVSTTEGTNSQLYIFSILFSNTTEILMNSLAIAHGGIHVTHSRKVNVSNVSLENGIMNFTQTVEVHISDITTCDSFDQLDVNTGYTSTCISHGVVLGSRDVVSLLNILNATITNVTIHYMEKNGIVLLNTSNTIVKNITILYTEKDGIVLLETFNTTVTNVTIHYMEKGGISLLNTFNTKITNITIHYTEEAGIYLLNASSAETTNITIHHAVIVGIEMIMSRSSIVSNVHILNTNGEGIIIKQSQRIGINGSVLLKGVFGIHFIAVNNSNITDCTIKYALGGICMEDVCQVNIEDTQVLHSEFNGLIIESAVDTSIKSLTIMNWTDEAVYASNLRSTNLVHLSLKITQLTTYTTNKFHGIVLYNCSNVTISQSNFTNIPSFDKENDVVFQPAVVSLYFSEENIIRDCNFEANNITALTVVESKVRISGIVNFTGNRAYRGAAMTFTQGGKMIVSEDSHITFKNNHARTSGGAIYLTTTYTKSQVPSGKMSLKIECFIQVEGHYPQHHLTFMNNTAGLGGDELYGGGLQHACNHKCDHITPTKKIETCLSEFLTVSDIRNSTLSNISSDPSRVCLCVDDKPDCVNIFKTVQTNGHGPYPGQTIEISAVVVGQNFGTVSGAVYAQLINSPFNNNTTKLGKKQETQGVNHNSCNKLQYTIYSPVENITIMLTSLKLKEIFIVTEQTFTETRKKYEQYENDYQDTSFPQAILEFPVYINIPLEPCPPGFSITYKHPVTCDCVRQLRKLPGVTCDIEDVTIYRSGQVWVGQLKSNLNKIDNDQMNVASARYCPFNYCKNGGIKIRLSYSHDQCNYNHSGIVCGQCIHDLSLILGSDQCLNCSNTYLLLLLPFAVAGVVLVAFIKLLDITVSSGFINSLIFYSNIVKVNEHIFLPHRTTNPITLFISWFNLDLGIETCFYDGLDANAKAWLQFVFPFYLWCIAGLIIILARYSIRFARLTGNNSVPVLATLFLLSYAKLLRNVITILSYTIVDTAQGQKVVWSADGNIDYLGRQHIPLFTAAIATLILLWLPYTTLFLLGQWVCTINLSFITRMSMKLKPFLDAHYGPMTDKHRYWFGILLSVRIVVFLISATVPASNFSISAFSVCITANALVYYMAIGPPLYRNKHVAEFEITLFINLALLGLTKFYVVSTDGNQTAATLTLLTVAVIQFLGLVLYKGYSTLKPVFTQYYQRLRNKEEEEEGDIDGEGIWRYDTSMKEWEESQNLTPYRDAATAL